MLFWFISPHFAVLQAVAVVLAVIAAKLGAEVVGIELLDPLQSLVVVVSVLATGVVTSLWKQKNDEEAEA